MIDEENLGNLALDAWAKPAGLGITRLSLQFPIGTDESPVKSIDVQRPKAKHLRRFDEKKPQADQILTMAEDLAGLTTNQINALDVTDSMRLIAVIARDFGGGLDGTSDGS